MQSEVPETTHSSSCTNGRITLIHVASPSDSSYSDDEQQEDLMNQLEEVKKQLETNPTDEASYAKAIQIYRSLGDVDNLRAIRLQYKQNCPLSPGTERTLSSSHRGVAAVDKR